MASPDCTELEWTYEPSDFFEARYVFDEARFVLTIDGGKAIAKLKTPTDPIPTDLEEGVRALVEQVFQALSWELSCSPFAPQT